MDAKVTINGIEYSLATNLRVAYQVQGKNNHAPYTKIFSEIGDMTLEKQIEILYVAFQVANPVVAAQDIPQIVFLNHYLDHSTAKEIMDQLKAVVKGILGTDDSDEQESDTSSEGNA